MKARVIFYVSLIIFCSSAAVWYYEPGLASFIGFLFGVLGMFQSGSGNEVPGTVFRSWNNERLTMGFTGVAVLVLGILLQPKISTISPDINLAYYHKNDGRLVLVDFDSVPLILTPNQILNNEIRIPINLALQSLDDRTLEVEKVVLTYSGTSKISSTGKPRIDPTDKTLIYEHSLGKLSRVNHYTPLETIDTVIIQTQFGLINTIALSSDRVPMMVTTLFDDNLYLKRKIPMQIEVFVADRPSVKASLTFHLEGLVDVMLDMEAKERSQESPNSQDLYYFQLNPQHQASFNLESFFIPDLSSEFSVYNVQTDTSALQYLLVNDTLRKVIIDKNDDGFADRVIIRSFNSVVPNFSFDCVENSAMIDWTKGR